MKDRVQKLSIRKKNQLVAVWMSKERNDYLESLDVLFYFDDEWNKIYQKNRTNGFIAAQLLANTHILDLVYG